MIFSITIIETIYNVLYILQNKKANYASLYKETRVSHITLQTALKTLLKGEYIKKEDKGHKKSYYEITPKGEKYFSLLKQLREMD